MELSDAKKTVRGPYCPKQGAVFPTPWGKTVVRVMLK